ncbi:HAMP domain-containing protein [Streptomyces sp. P38-E01]|uniref:Sensor histidine kinase MtrB n=1 Tax=Streptomyces tardus TaxID=2780544 RepID=A0A949JET4_9ACTN|nr:HAMP domain-containing protein [Streptomyces tardus]
MQDPGQVPPGAKAVAGRRSAVAAIGSRWRNVNLLPHGLIPEGATGSRAHPMVRMFVRLVRRPLLQLTRLWRRNLQLRVVAATLLLSIAVVLVLGLVVIGQVRNGLLDAKQQAAQSQAAGGFAVATEMADSAAEGGRDGEESGTRAVQNSGTWLTQLVQQLASGGQGVYSVVALNSDADSTPFIGDENTNTRGPRASGDVRPDESVSAELRSALNEEPRAHQQYGRIIRTDSSSQPALIIGKRLADANGNPYQLYYLFPFTQEEKTLSLVKGTLATAGVFVVVLLGAIAWLVVRQVVTPVRMAAGISERLAAGRLQERMKVSGEDDIARLGEAFNKMARNLQLKIGQLEELSRMQRRFVSDVSHELRTPLTTVRMAADVIHEARDEFDPVTKRSAELLLGQLDRFESLLAELLEISRFDAGAAALEAGPIDLREVVHRVLEGAEPLADAKGSRLRVQGDDRAVVVEADVRRVERILRNLVVNAIEHGEGREVVVKLAQRNGAVAVAVRDYGVGLRPGEAQRVFNRFWRADPARARTTGGTGLGLSIAIEDARLHGGWLQAWGEHGGGSQFRLTLPAAAGEVLRGSPLPLEPPDGGRPDGLGDSAVAEADASGPAGSSDPTGTGSDAVDPERTTGATASERTTEGAAPERTAPETTAPDRTAPETAAAGASPARRGAVGEESQPPPGEGGLPVRASGATRADRAEEADSEE